MVGAAADAAAKVPSLKMEEKTANPNDLNQSWVQLLFLGNFLACNFGV